MTGANASVVQKYTYDPYGDIVWQQDAGYDNAWRFAQGYFDTDISQTKLGVRYYGSDIARFTQFDPMAGRLSNPTSLNKYQYASNDPANRVDPTGMVDLACVAGQLINPFTEAASILGGGVSIAEAGALAFQYASRYGVSTLLAAAGAAPLIIVDGGVVAYAVVTAFEACA